MGSLLLEQFLVDPFPWASLGGFFLITIFGDQSLWSKSGFQWARNPVPHIVFGQKRHEKSWPLIDTFFRAHNAPDERKTPASCWITSIFLASQYTFSAHPTFFRLTPVFRAFLGRNGRFK
jgi:hypothetical protein